MDCSIYPKVLNNQGEPVDSNLFKEIFKFTKDRQVAKKYYLATKTSRFKAWFGNSQFTDNNGEPQVYFNEDGEMVLINDKDDVKAVFNNGTWGLQNTQQDIINYLAKEGIINKNRIYGQHVLPRPHTGSDMLENVYRNKTKPETKVSLNKIAAINEEISMKYNVFGNLIEVVPFGKTYKVNINATVLSQLNETNQKNMHFMPTVATVTTNTNTQNAGARFINYKEQKKNLVTILENRIVEINNKKKFAISSSEIIALNRVKSLIEARLNGNANQAGLYQELVEIESATVLPELEIMVGKDFDRVKRLILSDDYNDLAEADEILNFYIACSPSQEGNPLFTEPERAALTAAEEHTLNNWAITAGKLKDSLTKKKREALVNDMNRNISVQHTLGSVTVEGLKKSMPDASAFDKWLFDPTNGVFSHNGSLPQVMKMNIEMATSEALSETKRFTDEIKPLSDKAKEAFKKYNKDNPHKPKINWDIYFQKDIDGSETGRLVSRYSRKWEDAEKTMHYETDSKMYDNLNNPNYTPQQKGSAITTARKRKIEWYKHNGLILNLATIPEIQAFVNDPANGFDFLLPYFTSEDANNTLGIQGNHRTELIEKQKDLLMQFKYNYETYVEEILDSEGVADINALSAEGKGKIETWFHTHNPANAFNASLGAKYGSAAKVMRNGQERTIIPEMTYVVKFPVKKYQTSKYAPKGTDTHYYDDNFDIIDKQGDLYNFHAVAKKAVKFHKDVLPARDQREIMDGEIGMINKAVAEVFSIRTLHKMQMWTEAGRILWDRIRRAGWIQEQSTNDRSMVDATSSTESKSRKDINKGMLLHDRTQINAIFNTEVARFVEDFHSNKVGSMTRKINRHTTMHESLLTGDNISHLAEILGVPPTLADIKLKMKIETGVIPVGRILYNFATNKVVARKSRNLPKMLVFYTDLAANYAARTQIKPSMDTAMELYTSIKDSKTQNTGLELTNKGKSVTDGYRKNAITQVESWYDRAVLGNYDTKHFKVSGQRYTREEKKQIKDIDDQIKRLSSDPSEAAITAIKKLEETKRLLGHKIALSQFLNSFLNFTRLSYLGWAVNSAITNFLEGQIANEIAMAMEIYYPADNWYIATRAVRASQTKFVTKKLAKNSKMYEMANFTSHFMDRYTVLQDSRNEFQKAEIKTSFSLTAKLDPMLLNQSVEYANQAPILLTAMMSEEIEDEHGNKSTVYEAFDKKTMKLKPEFRKNPENIKNWEEMRGDRYHAFKSKLNKVIVDTHGDYDKLRGNLAKTTFTGKALLMFKGWLPRAIYNRFAIEQWDIETQRKHKGRYLSHTPVSAGIQGALIGAMIGPLAPVLIGAGVGIGLGMWAHKGVGNNPLMELWTETHILARRMIGMPLNRLTGGRATNFKVAGVKPLNFLNTNYRELINAGIVESKNELDAKNLMGNLAEMAMQLTWMAMVILAKSFFYDEDDEKNSARRLIHNLLVNRALTMANQATMYLDPNRFYKDSSSIAILRFLDNVKTFFADVDKAIFWNDIDLSQTDNRGKSRVLKSARKLSLVPIRGRLGFDSQLRQPILPHIAYERAFWSDYKRIEKEIEDQRGAYQIELDAAGIYTEDEIKKMKNEKYPTLNSQLKKGEAVYGITQDDIKEFREIKKTKAQIKKDRQKEKDKAAMERRKAMEAEINR